MAMSNAERQAKLRAKRRYSGAMTGTVGLERLDVWLLSERKMDLEILATMQGMTLRETLESVIEAAAKHAPKDEWKKAALEVFDRRRSHED